MTRPSVRRTTHPRRGPPRSDDIEEADETAEQPKGPFQLFRGQVTGSKGILALKSLAGKSTPQPTPTAPAINRFSLASEMPPSRRPTQNLGEPSTTRKPSVAQRSVASTRSDLPSEVDSPILTPWDRKQPAKQASAQGGDQIGANETIPTIEVTPSTEPSAEAKDTEANNKLKQKENPFRDSVAKMDSDGKADDR